MKFGVVILVFFLESGREVGKGYFFGMVMLCGRGGMGGKGAVLDGESSFLESLAGIGRLAHE